MTKTITPNDLPSKPSFGDVVTVEGVAPNPEGDVTGELASRKSYDSFLAQFESLLKEAFADEDLTRDGDLVDMLTDELHGKIDEALTEFYGKSSDDGLNVDDIDDEDSSHEE